MNLVGANAVPIQVTDALNCRWHLKSVHTQICIHRWFYNKSMDMHDIECEFIIH
jgi:hypothetical protein